MENEPADHDSLWSCWNPAGAGPFQCSCSSSSRLVDRIADRFVRLSVIMAENMQDAVHNQAAPISSSSGQHASVLAERQLPGRSQCHRAAAADQPDRRAPDRAHGWQRSPTTDLRSLRHRLETRAHQSDPTCPRNSSLSSAIANSSTKMTLISVPPRIPRLPSTRSASSCHRADRFPRRSARPNRTLRDRCRRQPLSACHSLVDRDQPRIGPRDVAANSAGPFVGSDDVGNNTVAHDVGRCRDG